ncbi:MAG: hypothetical protein ACO1OB_05250 [Archangium sp.]
MRRLVGVAALVLVGCLDPVSDVPDSGPEHRFLGRPAPADIAHRYFHFWESPADTVYLFRPTRLLELTSGELLLGPFHCAFLPDGGVAPASAGWRTDAQFAFNDSEPEWFVFDGGIYKSMPIEREHRLTVLGRYDVEAQQLTKVREYRSPIDAGILREPILNVRAYGDSLWFGSTIGGSTGSCHTERRRDFDFTPVKPTDACFFASGAATVADTTVVIGWNGTSTDVRRLRGDVETSREVLDGHCMSALDQQPGRVDFHCPHTGQNVVTIHRADLNSTMQLSSFTLPDGHTFDGLVRAEPLLVLTSTREDGGFAMHACNQTQCRRIADFSRWPPMVGATPETLSIAHYEPDAGVFLWRHRRESLGL